MPARPIPRFAQPGRLYLATEPTLLRLADPDSGRLIQFVLMPYPTPARYLADEASQRYQSLEEKNRHLMAAYTQSLHAIRQSPGFDPPCPRCCRRTSMSRAARCRPCSA